MGSQRRFNPEGGFTAYMYEEVGTIEAGGISGKVVVPAGGNTGHYALPNFTSSSRIYFKLADDGKTIVQMRVYGLDRRAKLDFDYTHAHPPFTPPQLHVHDFGMRPDGKYGHLPARALTPEERAQYGAILRRAMPRCIF